MQISLKGKLGENPTLSRNCKFGANHIGHCNNGKAWWALMKSQETCLVPVHTIYLRGNRWCFVRIRRLMNIERLFLMHKKQEAISGNQKWPLFLKSYVKGKESNWRRKDGLSVQFNSVSLLIKLLSRRSGKVGVTVCRIFRESIQIIYDAENFRRKSGRVETFFRTTDCWKS